ncbi:subtilisin family serine protease [Parabacteroides sp. PF5-5]|uniref:S8 family peptidase n=1 Tax=unclassified Parabacteroides TaxID=2649774 RepID=UPI0024737658|nr:MULTISPECIES: S8 family serine peptidase [unclassified Parabacteroides]MDH6303444.1 subtilisin family serine protease [Parabacteroides sp. PH5-39]MDH6314767.1 subtilisin family serine protease [Parabacteroides sp. PF5-13]MDH6318104.1 subtilisin family serine protease [Parabacteroides sp. PH5-13]MDH6321965.1 subtilisin family serine protease [Parabacteroides sp. PH5-8]MDH6326088.1 subtilisin family serine protease [Parabacteroides sp. PH5-41]
MIIRQCLLILCLFFSLEALSGESFCFRVYLKDKGDSGFTLDNPEAFLSKAAIDRRLREGKSVDESDLPIAEAYLDTLLSVGACLVVQSRWLSTVVVSAKDSLLVERLKGLTIVDSVKWVWKGTPMEHTEEPRDTSSLFPEDQALKTTYGYAEKQIEMLNGLKLHEAGYRGKGIQVAVIDAGFMNVDRLSVFHSLDLLGTYNVVSPGKSVFTDDEHGTKVLSCLAANAPGIMVGTAPEASYWLIKSEDGRSEYPVEEDYWVAAAEFADSVGVKVINSSLGYFTFDREELSYDPSMLDGRTAFISRAAEMAADKGILLFISAGNEGAGQWGKITFPSDARNVLTVGSVTGEKKKSVFSSVGFTADVRVKPDVVALGTGATVIDASGNVRFGNGTSFATPILAGLGICLWQALPWLSNTDLIALLQHSSTQYKRPDVELGYGIPDVYKVLRTELRNVRNK